MSLRTATRKLLTQEHWIHMVDYECYFILKSEGVGWKESPRVRSLLVTVRTSYVVVFAL